MVYKKKRVILFLTFLVCFSPIFSGEVVTFATSDTETKALSEGCGITEDSERETSKNNINNQLDSTLPMNESLLSPSEEATSANNSNASVKSESAIEPEKSEEAIIQQDSSELESTSSASEPRLITLGTSKLTSEALAGTCGQSVVHLAYEYVPLVSLEFNDTPIIVLQLPNEIAGRLNGNTANQTIFLKSLTGTVTIPNGLLANRDIDLQAVTTAFTLSYDSTNSAILISFPKTTASIGLLNKWKADIKFDVVALYKNGISIPPATNGASYAVAGDFNSATDGINLATQNGKRGVIPVASMSLGTCTVLKVDAPNLTSPILNNQTLISGKFSQTQDSGYTYTANISIQRVDGTTSPAVVTNVPVGSDGSFSTTLPAAVEYLDSLTATITAKSKTTTEIYQSLPSSTVSASWPLVSPTLNQVTVGATAINGTAVQTTSGTYKARLQINGDFSREQIITLPANGQYSFTISPSIHGGDKVSVSIQGYSVRTGKLLVETPVVTQTVAFVMPVLQVTQLLEKQNGQGIWETATSVVTGQTIRYTSTVTLTNANAIWDQQLLQDWIPKGLLNVSNAQVSKKNVDGSLTALGSPLLVANPSSPSLQAWNYQNVLPANNLTQANEALVLQYTAVVSDSMLNQNLVHSIFADGTNGGGQSILQKSGSLTTLVGNGTLRFIQVPATIEFKSIQVPAKQTVYNRTNTPNAVTVADGRVSKSRWHLYVREAQPLTSATNQVISGAFVYSQGGVDKPVSQASLEIMNYLSPDSNNVSINWQANEGIRLNLTPGPTLNANQEYKGSLEWTLSDAPL